MASGALLDDDLVLDLLRERLGGSADLARNGWLLDGFPRSAAQAAAMLEDEALRPDAVVLIERPDELVKEFCLGRCFDSTTGSTYHPIYAPPPEDVRENLVWRVDDTPSVVERRLEEHARARDAILGALSAKAPDTAGGVAVGRFGNARSELATFEDIASFLEGVALAKLARVRDELLRQRQGRDGSSGGGGGGGGEAAASVGVPDFNDLAVAREEDGGGGGGGGGGSGGGGGGGPSLDRTDGRVVPYFRLGGGPDLLGGGGGARAARERRARHRRR